MAPFSGPVKTILLIVAAFVLVFVAAALITGWLFVYRPLAVYAWMTRSTLTSSGLRKVWIESPAGKQRVWTGGHGPVVVLLHGAGDQAGTWSNVAPLLLKDHTLIIPDLAGHGASAPRRGPIDVRSVYAGFAATIDALSPNRRVTIVGNSLGAWMAMLYASRRPGRVEKIVCIDGGAIQGTNPHALLLPKTRAEARASVAQTRDRNAAPIPNFVLDDLVRQARAGALGRFASTASTMSTSVLDEAALRRIRTPVRLIWGASDKLIPLDYAQRMMAVLPNARLEVIDACGHVPQVECPDKFAAALQKALKD